jgi:hypothetical protein
MKKISPVLEKALATVAILVAIPLIVPFAIFVWRFDDGMQRSMRHGDTYPD